MPMHVGTLAVNPPFEFPYFHIDVNVDEEQHFLLYSHREDGKFVQHHNFVNYAHLLPHLATLELGDPLLPVPYAVITIDANHMNTSYTFM